MLKTVYGERTVEEAMTDYLNQAEDWDEAIYNGGECLRRWGRRIVYTSDTGREEYVRCATSEEAAEEFNNRRFPDEYDAIISESRDGYYARAEGVSAGTYETRDEAELALARWMVDNGIFPACWFVNERGDAFQIDEEIRAYHDEGGDKMRDDLRETR